MNGKHQKASTSEAGFSPSHSTGVNADDGSQGRVRQAFLAAKRGELLTPARAIVDICERLLSVSGEPFPDEFVSDVQMIHSSGHDLLLLIDDILSPSKLESAESDEDFDAVRSSMRHDMLNKLNPIINYSEMWLEEADCPPLAAYQPDLKMICESGKRCLSLIDGIIESRNIDAVDLADWDVSLISGTFHSIFDDAALADAPAVTGNLLVVDDNETNCEILRRRLELDGHRVSIAADGVQALEIISREDFDLVLLDIIMPEMNGFEVLKRMRADDRLRETPVIMISALNEVDVAVRCIEAGAEDYLSKPFNPVLLRARIGACLEKKRLHEREVKHLRQIEQQTHRLDELLHVIFPAEIVAELKATNAVVPRRYENVAVLFADLVDFTRYCDRNPAEEVVKRLQILVTEWENVAVKHGVEKIKTIGDAFMAAGGLLKPADNPVLNCVRCGLEMIEATGRLTSDWTLRIGIHCGPVVAGVLGQRQYLFDLWGDTVNTASRIESHGVPGQVMLSCQAWKQIDTICEGTPIAAVPVKGKGMLELIQFNRFNESSG